MPGYSAPVEVTQSEILMFHSENKKLIIEHLYYNNIQLWPVLRWMGLGAGLSIHGYSLELLQKNIIKSVNLELRLFCQISVCCFKLSASYFAVTFSNNLLSYIKTSCIQYVCKYGMLKCKIAL